MKMRGLVFMSLILCFLVTSASESQAFWWGRKEKEPAKVEKAKPEAEKPKKPAEEEKEPEKKIEPVPATADARRALLEKKRKLLNNTEWEIELSPLSGKGRKQSDTLTFSNNQVSSKDMLRQGFSTTNYTLTIQDDGKVIWETMQTSERKGIAFWRGEIDPNIEKMQGILSHRIDENTTRDYSFRSVSKKAIEPAQEK